VGEFFGVTRKLAGEDAKQLIDDGLGNNGLILLRDDAPQRGFASSAREHQSRNEDVGVTAWAACSAHSVHCQMGADAGACRF